MKDLKLYLPQRVVMKIKLADVDKDTLNGGCTKPDPATREGAHTVQDTSPWEEADVTLTLEAPRSQIQNQARYHEPTAGKDIVERENHRLITLMNAKTNILKSLTNPAIYKKDHAKEDLSQECKVGLSCDNQHNTG